MNNGKISVIVPCFNIENYIEETVKSILNQTYKNLEIILVDDGSTDKTAIIIDRLEQENENIFAFHKENGGVCSARLYGIEQASGEWIAFVDGDDLLKPEMYSTLINNLIKYNADISHCGYEMVLYDHNEEYYGTGKIILQNNYEGIRDLLSGQFVEPSLCNKIYKREIILKTKKCLVSMKFHNMEDMLWNYYFFKFASSSIYIDECYYQYVSRKGSASSLEVINRNKVLDPYLVFKIIENDVNNIPELMEIVQGREASVLISIAIAKNCISEEWVKKYSVKAQKIIRRKLKNYLRYSFSYRLKARLLIVAFSSSFYYFVYDGYTKLRKIRQYYR